MQCTLVTLNLSYPSIPQIYLHSNSSYKNYKLENEPGTCKYLQETLIFHFFPRRGTAGRVAESDGRSYRGIQ